MSQSWTLRPAVNPHPDLIAAVGGHPLVAQLLTQRGFSTPQQAQAFLDPAHYRPALPSALYGVAQAAHLLHQAIHNKQNILVWGDFDVDGQTSTSLLVAALQKLAGVPHVRFHVPNRFSEGHGIQPDKLAEKLADPLFQPQLLLTCDTGIAETAGVALAKERGLTVIITDHHDLPPEIADFGSWISDFGSHNRTIQNQKSKIQHPYPVLRADAIVNPKLQPPGDPLRTLPGVGVAFKLIQQLYELCACAGDEAELLDLVALGIVADVAEQVHDARYLLQLGLEKLRHTKRIGLRALMEVARLNPETVDAEAIGFQLGPRMNALGRLEDATVAVELLTTRDIMRASQLAGKMERLNQERRLLTSQITTAAMEMIERDPKLLDYNGLVLAHPGWHAGIVGIVASRLAEEYGKPVVLLLTPPGQPARGSARSVPGVDIGAAIAACGQLLLQHGGHPGAAGLSLLPENIDRFRRELDRQIVLHRDESAPVGLLVDAEARWQDLTLTLAEELRRLAPFGQGNPMPQFLSRNLVVRDDRRLGREGAHRKLVVQSADGARQSVMWFHGGDAELPSGPLDLVYTVGINDYRGERSLQLGFVAVRASQREQIAVPPGVGQPLQIHDLRNQTLQPAALPAPDQAAWFAEGAALEASAVPFAPRTELVQAAKGQPLVLWSVPPSPELLRWLVDTVQPAAVYVCGQLTGDDSPAGVLRQVGSMCKYALGRDRLLNVSRMAARLCTTEAVIRHSLLWLESRGLITLEEWAPGGTPVDSIRIAPGDNQRRDGNAALLQAELDEQLAEVRAYRRYFLRARVNELGLSQ